MAGVMKDGSEGFRLTFDDVTGVVYFTKPTVARAIHISACAWIEFEQPKPAEAAKK